MLTRRLAESVDGLNSSLALAAGDLWPKKGEPIYWLVRLLKPWNTIAGLPDLGQKRSFTLNYVSRHALNSSVASFCVTSNRCDCGNPHFSRFCKGASLSRLGSCRPDDSISVRRWDAHNPTIWFMGSEPVKSWNSLRHASVVVLAVYKRRSCLRP